MHKSPWLQGAHLQSVFPLWEVIQIDTRHAQESRTDEVGIIHLQLQPHAVAWHLARVYIWDRECTCLCVHMCRLMRACMCDARSARNSQQSAWNDDISASEESTYTSCINARFIGGYREELFPKFASHMNMYIHVYMRTCT